jgi:hypothetical protein
LFLTLLIIVLAKRIDTLSNLTITDIVPAKRNKNSVNVVLNKKNQRDIWYLIKCFHLNKKGEIKIVFIKLALGEAGGIKLWFASLLGAIHLNNLEMAVSLV